MPKSKLLSDVSITTVQAILTQLSGIIVFLIISKYLDKQELGYVNWSMAVLTLAFSVIGFGLEQVTVKKVAAGDEHNAWMRSYLLHNLVTGIGLTGFVWLIILCIPSLENYRQLFLLLALSQCFAYLAIPYRQVANGLEKFRLLFIMSCLANLVKVSALAILAFRGNVSLYAILYVYLLASFLEWVICIALYTIQLRLTPAIGFDRKLYLIFIKESLPQLGITVFNMAVQRMDWILLGLLSTSVMVAEYSFTNRLFELALFPLLVIAPVIFPKIAKMFHHREESRGQKMSQLKMLVRIEIVVSVFVALLLNICWKDLVDPLTGNKYGSSTQSFLFILSFAMPLVYLNNIFWSILFAQEKMKELLFIFFGTFLVNITADLFLIPLYQAKGAALGFVIALAAQFVLYFLKVQVAEIKRAVLQLFPVMGAALVAGFLALYLFDFFIWQAISASACYLFFLWAMRIVTNMNMASLKTMAGTY